MTLSGRIAQANSILQPYAVPHQERSDREVEELPDETRFPFQRDRDRILHATAFRRLKYKTQVFVAASGDHYRTRLTHTLEVAQISRDIARTLGLNEDLAESIALAHDLGHPPFGHAGEAALSACMEPYGQRFEHNEQSLRIVALLEERRPDVFGLNLSREIRDGLRKHESLARGHSLEAQIVNLSDEIAYTAHDSEDGLRAGLFSLADLLPHLPDAVRTRVEKNDAFIRSAIIHWLVLDLYDTTTSLLSNQKIRTLEDVYAASKPLVDFSSSSRDHLKHLRAFLFDHLYLHPSVSGPAANGQRIITELFAQYMKEPPDAVTKLQENTKSDLPIAVKDYIAGMTDGFAMNLATSSSPLPQSPSTVSGTAADQ